MFDLTVVLLIIAMVLLLLAGTNASWRFASKISLGWLGMFFFVAAVLTIQQG